MNTKNVNILFILTDDQGAWAMGCAGNKEIHTPNLDAMAARGIRFDHFFCASPVCSPARASILTGRIPSQHGVHDWLKSGSLDRESLGILREEPCFAGEDQAIRYLDGMECYTDILAANGYHCALAGKWHLGDSIHPQHGFTRWYTIGRGGCSYKRPDMVEAGEVHMEDRYVTDLITDKAITYLRELSEEKEPFYLSVHYTAPHGPWDEEEHPKEYYDLYRDCPFESVPDLPVHRDQIDSAPSGTGEKRKSLLRGYYAAITAMDTGVGKIMKELERTGELNRTLVIFMSDNGMNMGHHGIWGKGNGTFPLNLYDTSVKVPFLVSWPECLPQNRVVKSLHSQYDIMQTLLDLVGLEDQIPEGLPGKSFLPVLRGEEPEDTPVVVFDEYGPNRMIRNREWKLIHRYPYGPDELYHMTADPEEKINLICEESWEEVRSELLNQLSLWYDLYVDPRLDGVREGVTGFGQVRRAGLYSEGKAVYHEYKKNQTGNG